MRRSTSDRLKRWLCQRGLTQYCPSPPPPKPTPPPPQPGPDPNPNPDPDPLPLPDPPDPDNRFTYVWLTPGLNRNIRYERHVKDRMIRRIGINIPAIFDVPNYYSNKSNHLERKELIRDYCESSYAGALLDNMSFCKDHIEAWTNGIMGISTARNDSQLVWCYMFPTMVAAADLLKRNSDWDDARFRALLTKSIAVSDIILKRSGINSVNNWASWALFNKAICAAYLGHTVAWDQCAATYKKIIREAIDDNGEMKYEIRRDGASTNGNGKKGISYSCFALWGLAGTAEIFRINGNSSLYTYSQGTRSLKDAWEVVSQYLYDKRTPYNSNPQIDSDVYGRFGFSEILLRHWANPTAAKIIAARRPIKIYQAIPFVSFTHS